MATRMATQATLAIVPRHRQTSHLRFYGRAGGVELTVIDYGRAWVFWRSRP